mgnify:CR=1 FL=1|tara:strand:- start:599 stop:826 length:228 start_codon:yes stop_codon:yes gene_type:complete
MYTIDSNIPVPLTGRQRKYPFAEMEIGQSVFFAGENIGGKAYKAAGQIGARYSRNYIGRTATQDGVDGLRIWRKK